MEQMRDHHHDKLDTVTAVVPSEVDESYAIPSTQKSCYKTQSLFQ